MRISKRQLRRIIKEERARLVEQGRTADEAYADFDVEETLTRLNDVLYEAMPIVQELLQAIELGVWEDDPKDAMKTVKDQVNEWTYDAFGEYLLK